MNNLKDLIDYSILDFWINTIIYVFVVIPFFLVFWVYFKRHFKNQRIQDNPRSTPQIRRNEILFSFSSIIIFTILDVIIYALQKNGYTSVYENISDYGWPYFIFSIVYMILLHDAYFYWTHRLMHHPQVYKWVHKVHHYSTDPSPFAAFSFHPLETLVESGAYLIFSFVFPVHLFALITWQLIQMVLNVIAHLGYEIFPKSWNTHWLLKWKAPSTHHNMHHEKFNGNYGFYFRWWDKWMGTEFPDFQKKLETIQSRTEKETVSAPTP